MRIFLGIILFTIFLLMSNICSQLAVDYHIPLVNTERGGLVGNGITDLVWANSMLYVGTGYGLSITSDEGDTWQNFTEKQYGGKGGISALTNDQDGTIWIATGYDTTVQEDQTLSAGGGLRYHLPGSVEWVYIPQPKDAITDTMGGMKPTTTHVQNITFDIALLDTQIWIVSFGGGIRRSMDMGNSWEVITTDGLPFSAGDNLNHRGFSAMTENGNIWIGTAGGISKSSDDGESWERFYVGADQNPEPNGISGNWVIALAYNPWDNSVWAITLSTGGNEFNAISRTLNDGLTWQNLLVDELSDGTFARNIAFYNSAVYVATEKGVYKTVDGGLSWYKFPTIIDQVTGERLLTQEFYSVATSSAEASLHRVWFGSSDGLGTSADNGYSWTVFRSFVSTRVRTDPKVYAYPSPFSPERGMIVRFQYDITSAGEVVIDIYNFAMESVIKIKEYESSPIGNTLDRSASWDGRDTNGRMVDNGVYFFRANVNGNISWGKIVVIN
jgi:hypothetical protein